MKPSTTLNNKAALQQQIVRADSELVLLTKQAEETQSRIGSINAELDTLDARSTNRQLQRETAEQTVAQLRSQVEVTQAREHISAGTLANRDEGEASTKELAKRLLRAQQDLTRVIERTDREQLEDDRKADELHKQLEECYHRLVELAQKQEAFTAAREQAHMQLGEVEQVAILAHIEKLQREMADKEQDVAHARAALDDFAVEAKQRLAAWPELQNQVRPLVPYHDSSTDVLESALVLLDFLQRSGKGADFDSTIFASAGMRWMGLSELLDIYQMLNSGNRLAMLQERKGQLERLLSVYREMKMGV